MAHRRRPFSSKVYYHIKMDDDGRAILARSHAYAYLVPWLPQGRTIDIASKIIFQKLKGPCINDVTQIFGPPPP